MLKKISAVILLVMLTLSVSACGRRENHTESQTGWPSGQPQEVMAYYDGSLYKQNFDTVSYLQSEIPGDCEYIGDSAIVVEIPDEDFEMCCISESMKLYFSGEAKSIYYKQHDSETYRKLTPCETDN